MATPRLSPYGRPLMPAALAKRDMDLFLGRPSYDLKDYAGIHNPRMDGTMNVTDARNAGGNVMEWLPSTGAGPGSRGYRGEGHIQGYSAARQGTAADKFREWGGMSPPRASLLNELYRNQPGKTMGAWDRLQSQKAMDEADPNAAWMADQIGVAQGKNQFDKASLMQAMLQEHLAQKQGGGVSPTWGPSGPGAAAGVANGAADVPTAPEYRRPGEQRYDSAGNLWRWNEQLQRGEMIGAGPTAEDAARDAANQMWQPGENLGEGILDTPYGEASVQQTTPGGPSQMTVDNGQGSSLGGAMFPGVQGRQSAAEFFQGAANRQGPNKFAEPEPGYGGTKAVAGFGEPSPGNSKLWSAYNSAMAKKKMLGKRAA